MKMTLHIDEHVLADVMEAHDFETKTEAIDFALRELDRRAKLRSFQKDGMGMSPAELKAAVYPDYVPGDLLVAEPGPAYQPDKDSK
jgi:Arc/MetJ family transcription regulator